MKEPAVANSTCLIGLERAGWLHLLPSLFEPLVIPPKVQEEFGVYYDWLIVQVPLNQAAVEAARTTVDDGEAEAIVLAQEKGWRLIIDDKKARAYARQQGVRVIGTLGVLLRAKQEGFVPAVKPLVEALQSTGFRITPALQREVLRLAGEE
ncbi:Predicted nucleic acid-binding protein, contains PIN domain [Armatimonadetes bacterium GBS]|nr:MAG: nucleic acid-binding protein [Fimbriimonadales bacterium]CUU10469.1 Predicted nucleic acid-binding protein, contains PIN domain [Armatimonadetes bacterium GBS]CUU33735.1 Predicted nucleic acid-binding protein, contains PIN domain [Armatimonadetes bacterium GXS]